MVYRSNEPFKKRVIMKSFYGNQQHEQKHDSVILDAYGRRRFMGLAVATAAGAFLVSDKATAGIFGYSSTPVAGIPASWVKLKRAGCLPLRKFCKRITSS